MFSAWYQLGVSLIFNLFFYGYIILYIECTKDAEEENVDCEDGISDNVGLCIFLIAAQFGIQLYLGIVCMRFTDQYEKENAK